MRLVWNTSPRGRPGHGRPIAPGVRRLSLPTATTPFGQTRSMSDASCFICEKHEQGDHAPGGVLFEDDLVYVGHRHAPGEPVYRGWLVIETKRHVAALGDLTDAEARTIGWITNRLAGVLRSTAGAEHVYSMVYGDGVPHLHVHLVPRYPGTPRDFWGPHIHEWPDSPRVNDVDMRRLVAQLRDAFPGAETAD